MRFGKIILSAIFALGVSDLLTADEFARRGGGYRSSSSRSSNSRSSSSTRRSTQSRASTWGSRTQNTSSISNTFAPTRKADRRAFDQQAYDKAKASGTCYSTRSEATNACQVKHGGQYTSRYRNEPVARPDHIPRTTLVEGATCDIHYDSRYGGYGYRGPSRSWVMYNAFADAVMLEMLMSRHHYSYGHPHGHSSRRSKNLVWLGTLCMAVIFVLAIYFHVKE